MEAEEYEDVVGPARDWDVHILHQVEDVDGKPTDHKHKYHQEQDQTPFSVARVCVPFLCTRICYGNNGL